MGMSNIYQHHNRSKSDTVQLPMISDEELDMMPSPPPLFRSSQTPRGKYSRNGVALRVGVLILAVTLTALITWGLSNGFHGN